MSQVNNYKQQDAYGGWTRIEMLLSIYDLAIDSLTEAHRLSDCEDQQDEFAYHFIKAQKAILAIHAGLKPDEHEVAYNIARLLHFVLTCLEGRKFADAIQVLQNLRDGFQAIQSEANQLEHNGEIPPVESADPYTVSV